jgi:pyrroline-5-carboxylate reductase
MTAKQIEGHVAILGGGKMGEAIIAGLLAETLSPDRVHVVEKFGERADYLAHTYGVPIVDYAGAFEVANTIVMAVKPQDVVPTLAYLGNAVTPAHLIISVAAGITTAALQAALPAGVPVIRAMPNTPALVGKGMTAIAAGGHVRPEHTDTAEALFEAVGQVVRVEETQIDAVTAISGSGPAYFFLMVEALTEAGIHLGLARPLAVQLATATAVGAGAMLDSGSASAAQLRESVTSPGGTTAAALRAFDEAGLRNAVYAAAEAAHKRSQELGALATRPS